MPCVCIGPENFSHLITRIDFFTAIVENQEWADDLSQNWNEIAPIIGEYDRNDTVSELARSFYFGNDQPITMDSFKALGDVCVNKSTGSFRQ